MKWIAAIILVLSTALPGLCQTRILPWRADVERRLKHCEQTPTPVPAQPQIILLPQGYQQLPIAGQPYQLLPIQGQPYQQLPIQGQPYQQLPIPGQPYQQLPQPGAPYQQLPQQGQPIQNLPPTGRPQQALPVKPPGTPPCNPNLPIPPAFGPTPATPTPTPVTPPTPVCPPTPSSVQPLGYESYGPTSAAQTKPKLIPQVIESRGPTNPRLVVESRSGVVHALAKPVK